MKILSLDMHCIRVVHLGPVYLASSLLLMSALLERGCRTTEIVIVFEDIRHQGEYRIFRNRAHLESLDPSRN